MWTRARWLLKAGPSDYMLAMSVASASLPVIGKHLEPLGAATAMGVWGYHHMPDFVGATARSWFEPGNAELRQRERDATNAVTEAALRGIVAAKNADENVLHQVRRQMVAGHAAPQPPLQPAMLLTV